MNKNDLREYIRNIKRQFNDEQLRDMSTPITKRLLSHPAVAGAKTIMMYYSLPDEVYSHDIINTLVQKGKRVLLPAVINDDNMELRCYESKKDMIEGFFNIMEPVGKTFTNYEDIDVAIVPGMSFDLRGNRLGRGKGYYDRFLSKCPYIYKIGICFDFQKLPGIPTDENDVKMDYVI